MKASFVFFAIAIFGIVINSSAQEFLNSPVRIYMETGEIISSRTNEYAIISLNNQTNIFTVDLCVLLSNINKHDTLEEINQQLSLNFKGQFPIDDLDFYDTGAKGGQIYSITGDLTINDIMKSFTKINFSLNRSTVPDDFIVTKSYPYHISFLIEVDPIEFCLNNILPKCPKTIIVSIEDGIINKINDGNEKPECEIAH